MHLNEKIELYFFDPQKGEDEYTKRFSEIEKSVKAFSPLYLMRRQVLLLSGKLIKFAKPEITQIPYFSAILLCHIAIRNLVMLAYGRNHVNYEDYKEFYKKYLGLGAIQYVAIRLLRNGIEHNNFQLFLRLRADCAAMYNELKNHLIYFEKIDQKIIKQIKYFKVEFLLFDQYSEKIVSSPKFVGIDDQTGSALIQFRIQPLEFLDSFERGVVKLEKDILGSDQLKAYFNEAVQVENWIKINPS